MWESQAASRGQPPIQEFPQNPVPSQLEVVINPSRQRGFVAAQP